MPAVLFRHTLISLAQHLLPHRDFVCRGNQLERKIQTPTWRALLARMLNERDLTRLECAAGDLESAICVRLRELEQVVEDQEWARERLDIEIARIQLTKIQKERLGKRTIDENIISL